MEFNKPIKLLIFSFILLGIQQVIYHTYAIAIVDNTQNKEDVDLIGIWERKGYGELLVITNQQQGAERYQFTRTTCIKNEILTHQELQSILKQKVMATDKRSFSSIPERPFRRNYTKRTALPEPCQAHRLLTLTTATPVDVFEHFWHTFNDYYAFFNEQNVDWQQQYKRYRPQVSQETTDEALFELFTHMLEPINDGHITLYSEDDDFSPEEDAPLFKTLKHRFEQQEEIDDIDDYQQAIFERIEQNRQHYLLNYKQAGGKEGNVVQWGKIKADPSVAYIAVSRMFALTRTSDEDDSSTAEADEQVIEQIFARVLQDVSDTKALIIDMRLNDGGYDAVSMKIANHFASEKQLVLQKYARSREGNSQYVDAYLEPATTTYLHKPIVILSSRHTISAAEIFLLTMHGLPNVTILGERSNGALSDKLEKMLPNGWAIDLSNEVYLDYQDKNYEVVGVPVDIKTRAFSLEAIQQNRDPVLEKATLYLMQQ